MTCLLGHKWTAWERYFWEGQITHVGVIYPPELRGKPIPVVQDRQRRHCLKCGYHEEEIVHVRGT